MQLIVLGMHRSGTSVLARALNLMGAYFGPEGISTGANAENPKGFWERRDVRALNDAVLQGVGCDWNRVLRFDPRTLPPELLADFDKRAARLVLEMDAHRPWLIKEPRLCLLLSLWRKWLEAPVCIHVFRHPAEVASSLRVRNGMPMEAGLLLWERYVREALAGAEGLPAVAVSHRELMEAPAEAVARLYQALVGLGVPGLRMPAAREIEAFVEGRLYREREARQDLKVHATAPQVALFRALEAGATLADLPGESDLAPLAAYEAGLPPLEPVPPAEGQVAEDRVAQARAALKESEAERKAQQATIAALEKNLAKATDEKAGAARQLSEAVAEGKRLAAERKQLEAGLEEARTGFQAKLDKLAAQLDQANRERAAAAADAAAELEAQRTRLEAQRTELEAQRAAAEERQQAAEAHLAEARQEVRLALRDIARLTRRLLQREGELEVLSTRHAELDEHYQNARATARRDIDALKGALAESGKRVASLEARLDAVTGSFTWRAGAPVRIVARRMQRLLGRDGDPDRQLVRRSGLFDPRWYLERYPDVAESGMDPVGHYLDFGAGEGRDPGPGFSTRRYLERNADVAGSGMNALVHYLRYGREEGRKPC